ncbi:YqjF family protein [Roseiconus nitratireducens]|nr:DUF2071 domain-containing protein [Roseiconus nitratireducens]
MADRIGPTARPPGKNDGTQSWESLLFCHWRFDAAVLRPLVPESLELDLFEGQAFVGLVPFKMRDIKPPWLPQRWAFNFFETNVRTYVTYRGEPGVYFFSLDASSLLAVWAARIGWSLPYHHATMTGSQQDQVHRYQSHRRGGQGKHRVAFRVQDPLGASLPGTLEYFLLERYLLFVLRGGAVYRGQVHHAPYQAWTAEVLDLEEQLLAAAGMPAPGRMPDLVHYCPGVDVEVFAIERVAKKEASR